MKPVVSVVIVSDYFGANPPRWDDLRRSLRALACQDFEETVEFLLVENEALVHGLPGDFPAILPAVRIVPVRAETSYDLKNAGVELASADIVALLDADCEPATDWLRHLVETLRRHPEIAAVSGRTRYPGRSPIERLLNPLDRMFVDRESEGPVRAISNNNAGYRRSVYLRYPLSNAAGPFGGLLQIHAMARDGHSLHFQPAMRATHAFADRAFENDLRRQAGYSAVAVRQREPGIRGSWIVRLGYLGIPILVVARIVSSWWRTLRLFRLADLAWYQVPLVMGLSVMVHLWEIPGMWDAVRGTPVRETGYR